MQCSLPHEASTTWAGGTEPWASIQLRRRRPYAVDGLAISSQSPFRFVGEKFPIANPLLDNTTPSDAIIAPRGRGTSPQSIPARLSPLRLASSPEYRPCGRSLRTAMPSAFFCPISTSSRLPRVIPV